MKRAKLNYWIDVVMGLAFVASAISGMVFLLPLGFLSGSGTGTLGLSYLLWNQLHTWSSLAMIAAVGSHLLLHTKWIAAMTKNMLRSRARSGVVAAPSPRRRLLKFGAAFVGAGALASVGAVSLLGRLLALGEDVSGDPAAEGGVAKADQVTIDPKTGDPKGSVLDAEPVVVEPDPATSTPEPEAPVATEAPAATATPVEPTPQVEQAAQACVACPHGLVNDPYPGRCRRYVDRNGDRICDLSVPQECG